MASDVIDNLHDSLEEWYGIQELRPSSFGMLCGSRRSPTTKVSACQRNAGHGGSCWGTSSGRLYAWKRK